MTRTTIELNGKRYDAVTGKLMQPGNQQAKATTNHNPTTVQPPKTSLMTDIPRPAVVKPQVKPMGSTTKAKALDIPRTAPHPVAAHKPQHTKTLMRRVVSAPPKNSFKRQAKAVTNTEALVKNPSVTVTPKQTVTTIDPSRLKRATTANRSQLVRHFNSVTTPPPRSTTTPVQRSNIYRAQQPIATNTVNRSSHSNIQTQQGTAQIQQKQPSTDIFERALAHADSHKQPPFSAKRTAKRSHRFRTAMSIIASSAAIVLIIGFIAYQNAASIQLHLASSRAGISATLPRWHPAGFSISTFAYSPGTVTIHYNNTQEARSFSLTQVASNWDSSALLNDYVLTQTNPTYNTVQSAGSTIYTYGNNNATWVNDGKWYRLTTNGALSTSQIAEIATSM